MIRNILHVDANNFFASVELLNRPELKDKFIAVSGDPNARHGIILAKNDKAKKMGVKTSDPIWLAKRKCPDLILLPPHPELYTQISRQLFAIYEDYSDRVESFGIDEVWIDVTESKKLLGTPMQIAEKIRQRVKDEIKITVSIGVSFNKIFAKIGSDYKKPDAITEITLDNFEKIVWPLEINEMILIGNKTKDVLNKMGIFSLGDLAKYPKRLLVDKLGVHGGKIHEYANGICDEEIKFSYEKTKPDSIGHSFTLPKDISSYEEILATITSLSEMIYVRQKYNDVKARGISVTIKYQDLKTLSRRETLNYYLTNSNSILKAAMQLFEKHYNINDPKRQKIRSLGISIFSFENDINDINLGFDSENNKYNKIDDVFQEIRNKYGYSSIKRASTIVKDNLIKDLKPKDFIAFNKNIKIKDSDNAIDAMDEKLTNPNYLDQDDF